MDESGKIQSEAKLWNDFISGDEKAFKILYDRYARELFRFGLHFSQNEDLVFDAIHDLYIDLYKYKPQIKSIGSIKSYLLLSLKYKIFRLRGEENKYLSFETEEIPFLYPLGTSEEEGSGTEDEKLKMLEEAMSGLSDRQREAIYLRYVSGLSYEELSKVLHLNYQSARNLIHRGMEKLRKSYQNNLLCLFHFAVSRLNRHRN